MPYSLAVAQHGEYAHPELVRNVGHAGQTAGAQLVTVALQKLEHTLVCDVVRGVQVQGAEGSDGVN